VGISAQTSPFREEAERKREETTTESRVVGICFGLDFNQTNPVEPESGGPVDVPAQPEPQVFHRYYHLFVEGELRGLVERAAVEDGYIVLPDLPESGDIEEPTSGVDVEGKKWVRIKGVGWEADNWWIEGEVGRG
jgi:hypothetical protein